MEVHRTALHERDDGRGSLRRTPCLRRRQRANSGLTDAASAADTARLTGLNHILWRRARSIPTVRFCCISSRGSEMSARHLLAAVVISAAVLLAPGCATQSQMQVVAPAPESTTVVAIRLEPCVDRTGTKGRDLAGEATRLLTERLQALANFALREDAPLILTCEVTQFAEGSALKRWLAPGWGSTVGQIALMLSDAKDQSAVLIIQGNSTVSAGGLYTVGAENYILKAATDDVIAKLRAWAASPGAAARK